MKGGKNNGDQGNDVFVRECGPGQAARKGRSCVQPNQDAAGLDASMALHGLQCEEGGGGLAAPFFAMPICKHCKGNVALVALERHLRMAHNLSFFGDTFNQVVRNYTEDPEEVERRYKGEGGKYHERPI